MTHICVSKVTIIVSDNGLSPGQRQAIIWNNDGILLIGPLGTNFTGVLIEIDTFSFKKMHLKMSSGKWQPFCLGLNMLTCIPDIQWSVHVIMVVVLCWKFLYLWDGILYWKSSLLSTKCASNSNTSYHSQGNFQLKLNPTSMFLRQHFQLHFSAIKIF